MIWIVQIKLYKTFNSFYLIYFDKIEYFQLYWLQKLAKKYVDFWIFKINKWRFSKSFCYLSIQNWIQHSI